jgi:hypothetical protein
MWDAPVNNEWYVDEVWTLNPSLESLIVAKEGLKEGLDLPHLCSNLFWTGGLRTQFKELVLARTQNCVQSQQNDVDTAAWEARREEALRLPTEVYWVEYDETGITIIAKV